MSTYRESGTNELQSLSGILLNTVKVLAAAVCGIWVAGGQNLLPWVRDMSEWINGDNGPDLLHIINETIKLVSRITIGAYGSYRLLTKLTGIGQRQ
jgi:hypothetical protein